MDPLTALSLACGIIQVVDFCTKAVAKCRELYKDGSSSENEDLEEMANYLLSLCASLDVPNQQILDEIQELARKCSDTAEDLIRELRRLKIKRPRRKLEVASKAIKTLWKKEAIDDIWKRLRHYRKILDTHILVDLRQRFDLLSVQQSKGFVCLDQKIQTMITLLAADQKQVADEFQQDSQRNDHVKRLLHTLWFYHINHRQETIAEAHEKTFEWIFETEKTRKDARRWDDFVQWLDRGQDTYWINGKAGSGKSTLMNYIYQDDRTHNSLRVWSGTKSLLTPSFFFWNAGSLLQKSSEGLLRSLLHQVLEQFPEMTPTTPSARSDKPDYGPIPAWTERRLRRTLCAVVRQLQDSCRICIFIDGLDEIGGDQDTLIAIIKELQSLNVKICLSSRPNRSFSFAFESCAKLQLQDLTTADIKVFVSDKLQAPLPVTSAHDMSHLFDAIVAKAEGVFLWVELVVRDVLRGIENEDSLGQMYTRILLMPSAIEELYAHMLSNIGEIYQEEAAKVFHMVLAGLPNSLLDVSLTLHRAFDQACELSTQNAIRFCGLTKKRMPNMCAGLLEVQTPGERPVLERPRGPQRRVGVTHSRDPIRFGPSPEMVNFFHRTSVDFLRNNEQGKRFMRSRYPVSWNPYDAYVRTQLAKWDILGLPVVPVNIAHNHDYLSWQMKDDENHSLFVSEVMRGVSLAEEYAGSSQILLCRDVDRILTLMFRQKFGHTTNTHWCTQWGFNWIHGKNKDVQMSNSCSVTCLRLSPRPISAQSSQQEHPYDPGMLPAKPVDFLGLACAWGLTYFVHQFLDSRLETYDSESATYLLCCSMWTFKAEYSQFNYADEVWNTLKSRWLGQLHLVSELLKMGANSNYYVEEFSATIWGEFLTMVKELAELDLSTCGRIVKAFFEHGANLETVHMRYRHCLHGVTSLKEPIEVDIGEPQIFYSHHDVTVLYLIQDLLGDTPEFDTLVQDCTSKAVRSLSRCTYIRHLGNWGSWYMNDVQYDKFKAALIGCNVSIEPRGRVKHARQIVQLMDEVSNGDWKAEYEDSSYEEVTSDGAEDYHSTSSQISLSP